MANASGLAAEKLRPGTFVHAPSSMEYTIAAPHVQPTLSYRSQKKPDVAGDFPLEYFLGSGHLGTTYLYSVRDFLFESPVAWYGTSKSYDMKPGLSGMDRMPPPIPMQSDCMRCHMSALQASDAGTINRYRGLAFLHSGITCEACHGDAETHVRSGGKAEIVNPARLGAEARDSICISCHLEGDILVERAGHSVLDYRPGQSISSFLAFYVNAGSNVMNRGVSEVEQLSQSTCKRISGDRMSCTSCHDSHYTPEAADKAAFFRSKCLVCHSRPDFARTHHPENKDCTSCHMPRTGAENIPHVAWTDHRILRQPGEEKHDAAAGQGHEDLVAIFSPGATARDLAMANYKALLEGDRRREPAAWEQLNAQREAIANDPAALDALGNLNAERGNSDNAEQEFRRVLTLAPDDLTALSNLGVLLAKEGKLKEALPLLEKAFSRNQDLPGLSMNLARVQCRAGDGAGARATLETTLAFGSDLEDVRRLLPEMNNCQAK
ncbi:MAG TPA: tetratricopeptide repeat protein [Terracidiphilus sp.]